MTRQEFATWLASAAPGHTIVYYAGSLAHDRGTDDAPNADIDATATAAMAAFDAGAVHLVQRRCKGGAEYLAVRRPLAHPEP
jgi:hypothetical protein